MKRIQHIPGELRGQALTVALRLAQECGFDGVEISIGDGLTCELSADEDGCRALREEAERCGSRVISASLAEVAGAGISSCVEEQALAARERVRTATESCRRLGADTLRIVPAAPDAKDGRRWHYQDALNETYRSLQVLRGDFERAGVVGSIEVCRHRFLLSPPEARELIDRVNSPWVGAALDWAVCEGHGDPLDWAETLQSRLGVVVVRESSSQAALSQLGYVGFGGAVILMPS